MCAESSQEAAEENPKSEVQRRDFLKGTAAFAAGVTAALTATQQAEAGDASFMNNVPDPLFAGKELPSFKFALQSECRCGRLASCLSLP